MKTAGSLLKEAREFRHIHWKNYRNVQKFVKNICARSRKIRMIFCQVAHSSVGFKKLRT